MKTLDAIAALIPTLAGRIDAGAGASDVQAVIEGLDDAGAVAVLREAGEVARLVEQVQVICAGVIARRSAREAGHAGLAQARGHRSAASLMQDLGGMSKTEAARQVRVGEALLEDTGGETITDDTRAGNDADPGSPDGVAPDEPVVREWRQVLRDGLRSGAVTSAQFDAIRRGLGDPPDDAGDAWVHAAAQLLDEAGRRTVEELAASARTIRDLLDPEGAESRFLARYEKRAFRTWFDQDGMRRASIAFDDEGGALVDTIFAAALRPRRGGPRFVDPEEKASAADLAADPRTNDQLSYDLLLDLLRTGALADPTAVFGTRQAGVRLVQQVAPEGTAGAAFTEDGLTALPATVAERHICETGAVTVTVDACGNPLDVGRESRLFTPTQRIALAIRDGGCRWTGCDRPASYCEAHHIDEWARDEGRTDIDRGILLCRFHHMQLHHGRWQITRDGKHDFVLHHPDGQRSVLHPRLPLRYAWGDIDPPPPQTHTTT
ncbi:DUF222 domain-containing protein [Microbacterium sp. NPDC089698]|uniref:HNH endonuclease signature motif containing protein n=1 Tax=Microbacterium sp. NPDC089698 TaxID=3364200 RepID=UPI00382EDA3B